VKTIPLFQYGKGNIGEMLIKQILQQNDTLAIRYGFRFEYLGFCGQRRTVVDPSGLEAALREAPSIGHVLSHHPASRPYPGAAPMLDELFQLHLPDLCMVDTTAAEMTEIHRACLHRGVSVVTANKKPLTADYGVYEEMQRLGRGKTLRYWYETTAGAGLPVISTLRELVATGDRITEITGCLSGTLGYICAQLDTGRAFSDIVREAKALGYTEPDPRDDLNGMDVARKALILAREIGYTLNLGDVVVNSMVPDTLLHVPSLHEFMERLPEVDALYARHAEESRGRGRVLRYMATIKEGACGVALKSVPKDSPAGSLAGPDNLIVFTTARYAGHPMVIRGPGAGPEVTAAGLFGDLIRVATVGEK
jgi:homoserine dehydrogenase